MHSSGNSPSTFAAQLSETVRGTRKRKGGRLTSGNCQRSTLRPRCSAAPSPQAWRARVAATSGPRRSPTLRGTRDSFMRPFLPTAVEFAGLLESPALAPGKAVQAFPGDLVENAVRAAADVDFLHESVPIAAQTCPFVGAVDARFQLCDRRGGDERPQRGAEPLPHPERGRDPAGAQDDRGSAQSKGQEEEQQDR